jgi:DNA repair protein RadC
MACLEKEEMRVLLLNQKNRLLAKPRVYEGSVHTTVVRISELFRDAVRSNCASLIVAHNHPSGDPTPSPEDAALTREIVKAGALLDIEVLDHLVIGAGGKFTSLKERGLGFDKN